MDVVLTAKLLGFAMVLTRISGFFLLAPVFGLKTIPKTVKVAVVVLLSTFFCVAIPPVIAIEQISTVRVILLLCCEATYGLALGTIANVLFTIVKLSSRIVERQMGLLMANILDPLSGERGKPVGALLEIIFTLAFLVANGHHLLIKVIQRSYELFPAGKIPTTAVLAGNMLEATSILLIAGFQLAAPILTALLLLLIALAIFARIVPEMNIFFISFPLRIFIGLVMLVVLVPCINEFVGHTARLMAKILPL